MENVPEYVDEFIVAKTDGDVISRHDNEQAAIAVAKKANATVTRVRMTSQKRGKRSFVDYDNPIEEVKVYP